MKSEGAKYIVSIIILLLAGSLLYCEEIKFQRISVEQGLSHGSVYSIIQDRDGYMWFGTGDGLNKYDGYDFKTYRYDPSDPDSIISGKMGEIYQDRRGIIWIGTWGSGLSRFDPISNHFVNFNSNPDDPGTISHNRIEVILEDKIGNIWIGTEKGGLNKLDPVSLKFTRYQNNPDSPVSLIQDEVKALCEDQDGNIWIGTDGGLSLMKTGTDGSIEFVHQVHIPGDPYSLSNNRIRALCVDLRGHVWVGTKGGGVSVFNPKEKTIKFSHFRNNPGNENSISEDAIASLFRDSEGDIWIGTYNKGLNRYCLKDNKFTRFYHDSRNSFSLSNNRPEVIFEDHSKNLWIGTLGGGVSKLDLKPKKFKNHMYDSAERNSLPHPAVRSISEKGDYLYIGTEGGLTRYNPEKDLFVHYRTNPENRNSISGNRIWSVMVDRKGYVWAGTFSNGLNKIQFKNGKMKVTRFNNDPLDEKSLSYSRVQVIFEDNDGDIWAGTSDGLNLLPGGEKKNKFQRFFNSTKNENTLSSNYIIAVYQDSSGSVWIGTLKGLNRFDKTTGIFSRYLFDPDEKNSLSNNTILTITESIPNPGILWIGTDDGGLNRFDVKRGIIDRYLEKDGLPGNVVSGILEDDKGFLWLSTNGGLSKFDPVKKTFRNYKKSSGIEGLGFIRNSSLRSSSGELYFGSITGMISFLPEDVQDNPFVPRIVITSFKKLGEEVRTKRPLKYNDEIRLTYKENFISLEFAALDYTNIKENKYSYFLKGVDYGWINSGTTRVASYNHLSPGNYLFSVKGSNNDGIWGDKGASLKIIIVPAYWQTLWFRIIVISLALFLIVLLYRGRVNRITGTNKKLSEINLSLSKEIKSRIDAEEALRESEESYKTLFISANDAIFLLKDEVFVKCNMKTPQLFGFKDESGILGKSVVQFSPDLQPDGQDSSHFSEFIKNALSGETERFNWTFIKEDGTLFDAEISLNKLETGKQFLIQVILRDITEQKKLQERLAVTQKMESIGELVGGIAHDFNNILTAINGYAEMALQKMEQDKWEYRIVNNILKSGKQAVDLVQKLLGFSRKQIIKPKVIDINKAIRELNEILARLIGEDIEIEYFLKEGISPIKADYTQIEQIIMNLCINSRDAINQKTHQASRKKIVVETNEIMISDEFLKSHFGSTTGKHIQISVSDNGVGIKPEIIEKIFEPFFTTKSFGKGTGLGLSTVYGIVKQNHGSIYVYSEDGDGTTVKIYWPVSKEIKQIETITSEVEEVKGGNETILFVEDDESVREFSVAILEDLGYKVHKVSNGQEAVEMIKSGLKDIDLLITDVIMPKMGGKELEGIARGLIPGLKVLFASGYTDDYIVHSGVLEEGVNFIQKPFSIRDIAKKIREVISED